MPSIYCCKWVTLSKMKWQKIHLILIPILILILILIGGKRRQKEAKGRWGSSHVVVT